MKYALIRERESTNSNGEHSCTDASNRVRCQNQCLCRNICMHSVYSEDETPDSQWYVKCQTFDFSDSFISTSHGFKLELL